MPEIGWTKGVRGRVGMANVSGGTTRAGPPPRAFIRLIISS